MTSVRYAVLGNGSTYLYRSASRNEAISIGQGKKSNVKIMWGGVGLSNNFLNSSLVISNRRFGIVTVTTCPKFLFSRLDLLHVRTYKKMSALDSIQYLLPVLHELQSRNGLFTYELQIAQSV
jgi:hypothetical protein